MYECEHCGEPFPESHLLASHVARVHTDSDGDGNTTTLEADDVVGPLQSEGLTYEDFEERFGASKKVAKRVIRDLREAGHAVDFREIDEAGTRLWYIPDERNNHFQLGDGGEDGRFRFALMGDTHLGSEACHLDALHDFYDEAVARDVDFVLHTGDISDGWGVHQNQVNEVVPGATGWNRLIDYVIDNYPQRDGLTTHWISGNHDRKLYRRQGVRMERQVDAERDDLNWLADSNARIWLTPDVDIELIHPSGGKPYTLGYRIQTLLRERPVSNRPSIFAVGHLHGSMHAKIEGTHGFYTGCWKGLTTWGKRKGHATSIGGYFLDLTVEDGDIRSLGIEWMDYQSDDSTRSFELDELETLP